MTLKLTPIEKKLVTAYAGKGTVGDCAEYAGISYSYARKLLKRPKIQNALRQRKIIPPKSLWSDKVIASRIEREIFLSDVMRDESLGMAYRLKACEMHSKMHSEYTETVVIDESRTLASMLAMLEDTNDVIDVTAKGPK